VFEKYFILAGNIYEAKLNELVFYNLKAVKLHVAYIGEQNVTQDRTQDVGMKDKVNNKPWY
jgi:hypothetical protein